MKYDDMTPEELEIVNMLKGKSRMEIDQILAELEEKINEH